MKPSEQAGQAKHGENYMYYMYIYIYVCVCVCEDGFNIQYNISEEGCGLTVQMSFMVFIRSLLYKTVFKSPHLKTGLTKSKHFHPWSLLQLIHNLLGILISDILTSMRAKNDKTWQNKCQGQSGWRIGIGWPFGICARHPLLGIRTHSGMSLQGQWGIQHQWPSGSRHRWLGLNYPTWSWEHRNSNLYHPSPSTCSLHRAKVGNVTASHIHMTGKRLGTTPFVCIHYTKQISKWSCKWHDWAVFLFSISPWGER